MSQLSQPAQTIIEKYMHLAFGGTSSIACPYYNNKRQKVRGALRVLVGKGSADEIIEEATLMALREKIHLSSLSAEQLNQFLVDHNLGIDCSALSYYILSAEVSARTHKQLKNILRFPQTKNPLRLLIRALRKVENTDVTVLADDKNSSIIPLDDAQAGDFIAILETGSDFARNHIVTIHEVEVHNNKPTRIHYTHSLQWSTDGKYTHGIRQGSIDIIDNKPLLEQSWLEQGKSGNENETFKRAKEAKRVELRRLNCLRA